MKSKLINLLTKNKIILIFLAIALFACIPYLTAGTIDGDDMCYHLTRIICISDELKAGHFPILIHSEPLNNFGYADPLFYPEIFLYIPAILINLGLGVMASYKFFIILITFSTTAIMYYSMNRIMKNSSKSLFISLLYTLATYRLGDVFVRAALGEILAFTFLPLVLVGLYEIIFGENKKWWIICLGIFGVVNCHVISAVFVLILIIIICLINIKKIFKDKKRIKNLVLAGIVSILLSLSFILPYLEQTFNDDFRFNILDNAHFLEGGASSLQDFLKNELKGTGVDFSKGSLLLILAMLILNTKDLKWKNDEFVIQCFILGIVSAILSSKLLPWENMKFFGIIQFPFRISMISELLFSVVAGEAVFRNFKNSESIKLLVIFIIFIAGTQLSNVNINKNDVTYEKLVANYPLAMREYCPVNFDNSYSFVCMVEDEPGVEKNVYGEFLNYIDSDKNIINRENINTIDYKQDGTKIEFYYDKQAPFTIHIPLTYYKGYVAYLKEDNGECHDLKLEKEQSTANIIVSSDENLTGTIVVEYKMTIIQKIGYTFSLVALIGLIVYVVKKK